MRDTAIATLETDEQSARRVADLFAESFADDVAVSLTETTPGTWRVTLYFQRAVDEASLRDLAAIAGGATAAAALRFKTIAAKDWVAESLVGLKPVAAGRFTVHGAHDRSAVPANRIGIEIEAALAFGTGHHGTTRGCLLALDRLCKTLHRGEATPRILDLGTGTGILAIAAARALRRRVLATDIDAAAVRAARGNARLNRAGALVEVVKANGLNAPAIRAGALVEVAKANGPNAPAIRAYTPFDLVFANILLEPLRRLASPLTNLVAPGGTLVLSGLLTPQANAALAAYHAFRLERRIVLDGWTTLVLRRAGHRRSVVARARRGS